MKKLLLLLLCVPLMFSCGEKKKEEKKDNTEENKEKNEENDNEIKSLQRINLNDKDVLVSDDNKNWIKSRDVKPKPYSYLSYKNQSYTGIVYCLELEDYGDLLWECEYINSEPNGIFKKYYNSGQLKEEHHGPRLVEGNGFWKKYYKNGQVMREGNFKDGKQDGLWKHYYENGQLSHESNWKGKELISKECWDEDGNEIECE